MHRETPLVWHISLQPFVKEWDILLGRYCSYHFYLHGHLNTREWFAYCGLLRCLFSALVKWNYSQYEKCTSTVAFNVSDIPSYMRMVLLCHYNDVIMGAIVYQITSLSIVYSIVYSDADQRKHQSFTSLAFVRGIHRGPVNSSHKWPVTRKMFPCDDVLMLCFVAVMSRLLYEGLWFIKPYSSG